MIQKSKVLGLGIATALMLSASTLSAKDKTPFHIHAGYTMASIGNDTGDGFTLGATYVGNINRFSLRFTGEMDILTVNEYSNILSIGIGAGYEVVDNLTVFADGILGSINDSDLSGAGYDIGLTYQVIDHVALYAKYKSISMEYSSGVGPTVDVETTMVGLDFNFLTSK